MHILYIGANAFARTRALRARAIERPILVVTEDENGIDGGGVINFIEVNRNLRFEISLNAADRSGLKINSALLSVAARVERRPQGALNCLDGYPRRQRPSGVPHQDGQRQVSGEGSEGLVNANLYCVALAAGSPRRCMRSCWPPPAIR